MHVPKLVDPAELAIVVANHRRAHLTDRGPPEAAASEGALLGAAGLHRLWAHANAADAPAETGSSTPFLLRQFKLHYLPIGRGFEAETHLT